MIALFWANTRAVYLDWGDLLVLVGVGLVWIAFAAGMVLWAWNK
jgi:hypothetical protein